MYAAHLHSHSTVNVFVFVEKKKKTMSESNANIRNEDFYEESIGADDNDEMLLDDLETMDDSEVRR